MASGNLKSDFVFSGLFSKATYSPASPFYEKYRLARISLISVAVAALIGLLAKGLMLLVYLVTSVSFFGHISLKYMSPAENKLGLWVIIIPVIGGLIVGFMAKYGSAAIRGHGIPEAMEQILVNESRIKPSLIILKPVSSAIAIGTGGPFGAEGPVIATGGALGSLAGQLFRVTANERKIILAAGATAGMSAIFGTPVAAVFLAIELLLFEFSPRSILPVALACITGAAAHHLLFEAGPVFPMPTLAAPDNFALAIYSLIGLFIGFLSIGISKTVYLIEDGFEHLPLDPLWWPALGGLAVGLIGYLSPATLGVGYSNITGVLSGTWAMSLILGLCVFKFLSWAIALGSGTSGGTLAPLLTIGGAAGALAGMLFNRFLPGFAISIPMAALVGMSAMFAGASRAFLTSITFALESTMQSQALLPLLGACTAAYLVSFFLMENTIMTEKIARRGIKTPDSFGPDRLEGQLVADWYQADSASGVLSEASEGAAIYEQTTLGQALDLLQASGADRIPVLSVDGKSKGYISFREIMQAYSSRSNRNQTATTGISLRRRRLKLILQGKKLLQTGISNS